MAGFGNATRALYTGVRELFENALDAGDAGGKPPDITLEISCEEGPDPKPYTITVTDNGPGMPAKHIPGAFGTVLYGSKFGLRQARGMFGMGATMAILYGQITCAKPVHVESGTDREWHSFKLKLDIERNKPVILSKKKIQREHSGLKISVTLDGDYSRSGAKLREYVKRSALITPYASIRYIGPTPDDTMFLERVTDKVPKSPAYTTPHPHGSDAELIKRMINETLKLPTRLTKEALGAAGIKEDPSKFPTKWGSAESRMVGIIASSIGRPASEITNAIPYKMDLMSGLLELADSSGRTSSTTIKKQHCATLSKDGETLSKFLTRFQRVGPGSAKSFLGTTDFNPKTKILAMEDSEITRLANALKSYEKFSTPDSSCLAPLGADLLKAGMNTIFEPDFVETIQRPARSYSGSPFIVECGVAYGGKISSGVEIYRFANRIPLLYDEGADAVVAVIKDNISWRSYEIKDDAPLAICTHICSTRIPYKSAGKENVSSRPEIDKEIKLALQEVGRKLGKFVKSRIRAENDARREGTIKKYVVVTAKNACELVNKEVPDLEDLK